MGCLPTEKLTEKATKQEQTNAENLVKIAEKFESNEVIKQFGDQSTKMWWRLVDSVMGEYGASEKVPTVEQLKLLNRIVDKTLNGITKERGNFAKWFYLPQEIFKDIDYVDKWYKNVQKSHQSFKGNTSYFNSEISDIIRLLKEDSFTIGTKEYLKRFVPGKRNAAQKKLEKMYKEYNRLKQKGDFAGAEKLYSKKDGIYDYVQTGEGQILREFHELASAPKDGKGNFASLVKSKKYPERVIAAAEIWRNNIQPEGTKLLIQGIKNLKNALESNPELQKFDGYNRSIKEFDSLLAQYSSKELQKNGYFPVLTFDVLPTLTEVSNKFTGAKNNKQFSEGVEILERLKDVVEENIYTSRHLKEQNKVNDMIDYNVFPIMDSYVKNVSRFNYASYNTAEYMGVMKNLSDTLNRGDNVALNKKINFLQGYISDTYSMVSGTKYEGNAISGQVARGITAFQFASKLGLNLRGAARNSTQSLFNYVWFGGSGIAETRRMLKNDSMLTRVNEGLANNGVLFPEIQEIYGGKLTKTEFDAKTGTYKEVIDLSMGDAITESMSKVAETLGKPMQWVENNINRRWTFQLGYTKQWSADAGNKTYIRKGFERKLKRELKNDKRKETVEQLRDSTQKDFELFGTKVNEYEFKFEMHRRKRAEDAGNFAVNNLHFDYNPTAKSKVLTTKVGSVLGQFQHYGINFFNLQRKIVRDGAESVFTKQWDSPAAWRMYRLGILYTAVNGLFAPLLNANLGNLIQNDTLERVNNYRDAFIGDEEEKKRAFFGKGPLIGTFGGPMISDIVNMGNILGLYEMDEDSATAYLAGYQDMSEESDNEKVEEVVRLINTQGHRLIYNTIPKWSQGVNLGVLIQGELGLFPNEDIKKKRKFIGLDKKKSKKKESKKAEVYDYNKAILDSLSRMEKISK